eukprot:4023576-Pleurochrysis_carterae.AAC.3
MQNVCYGWSSHSFLYPSIRPTTGPVTYPRRQFTSPCWFWVPAPKPYRLGIACGALYLSDTQQIALWAVIAEFCKKNNSRTNVFGQRQSQRRLKQQYAKVVEALAKACDAKRLKGGYACCEESTRRVRKAYNSLGGLDSHGVKYGGCVPLVSDSGGFRVPFWRRGLRLCKMRNSAALLGLERAKKPRSRWKRQGQSCAWAAPAGGPSETAADAVASRGALMPATSVLSAMPERDESTGDRCQLNAPQQLG